jgi:hypothetical protein
MATAPTVAEKDLKRMARVAVAYFTASGKPLTQNSLADFITHGHLHVTLSQAKRILRDNPGLFREIERGVDDTNAGVLV